MSYQNFLKEIKNRAVLADACILITGVNAQKSLSLTPSRNVDSCLELQKEVKISWFNSLKVYHLLRRMK